MTAVEWLFEKLWDEPKDKLTWYAILKQAKEMEREQIINAYNQMRCVGNFENGDQYYNETYEKGGAK